MKTKNVCFVVILLCILGLGVQAVGDEVTLGSDADTYLRDGRGPFGDEVYMWCAGGAFDFVGYLRFDLSEYSAADISAATLTLHTYGGYVHDAIVSGRFAVYGLADVTDNTSQAWDESTLTSALAGDEWDLDHTFTASLGDGRVINLDADAGADVTEVVPNASSGTCTLSGADLVSFLQARVNDDGLATFIITLKDTGTAGKYTGYGTKEAPAGYEPALALTYTPTGATNPVPGDGDTVNADTLTQLSWTLLPQITTCRVYFGTEPNLLTMDSITFNPVVTSVNIDNFPSFPVLPLTEDTYHWRVDCWDTAYADPNESDPNYFRGAFWSFDATSAPIFNGITPAYQAYFVGDTADDIIASFTSTGAVSYEWFKSYDDATDTLDDDESVATGSTTLSLGTLAVDDKGYYYCVADNGASAVSSDTVRVSIKRQIVHYAFDGNVTDTSGNGLDATLYGNEPNFVASVDGLGQALWFDGTSDYVQCPNDLDLTVPAFDDFLPGLTISVWAKPDAAGNHARFIDFGNVSGENVPDALYFSRSGTSTSAVLEYDPWPGGVTVGSALELDTWQMLVVTMDEAGNVVMYRNGLSIGTGTQSSMPTVMTRSSNFIGQSHWPTYDALYSGLMDDLQIWNYALTEDNVADMYAAVVGDYCRYPENTGDYNFDDTGSSYCIVDLADFAVFAAHWLDCGFYPDPSCQ